MRTPRSAPLRRPPAFAAALLLLLGSCADEKSPVGPQRAGPQAVIADAAHGGAPGFYFLPPMVPRPRFSGVFEPDFLPWVQVTACVRDAAGCAGDLAVFSASGQGSERLRVDDDGEAYHVNWSTPRSPGTYRVTVEIAGLPLGWADVALVQNGGKLKDVPTGEIGAVAGQTLPVRFRIEEGAGGVVLAGPEGATVDGLGGAVTLTVPAGALAGPQPLAIRPLDETDPEGGFALLPAEVDFQMPATLTVHGAPLEQPEFTDDDAGDAQQHVLFAEDPTRGWLELGSVYDFDTGAATLELDGTSVDLFIEENPPALPADEPLTDEDREGEIPDPSVDDGLDPVDPLDPTTGADAVSIGGSPGAPNANEGGEARGPRIATSPGASSGSMAAAAGAASAARTRSHRYVRRVRRSRERKCVTGMRFDPVSYLLSEGVPAEPWVRVSTLTTRGATRRTSSFRVRMGSGSTESEHLRIESPYVHAVSLGTGYVRATYLYSRADRGCQYAWATGRFTATHPPVRRIRISTTPETWEPYLEPGMSMQLVARLTDINNADVTGLRTVEWWSGLPPRRWFSLEPAGHIQGDVLHLTRPGIVEVRASAWNARSRFTTFRVHPLRAHHITASVESLELEVGESQVVTVELFKWNGEPLREWARFGVVGHEFATWTREGPSSTTITGVLPGETTLRVTGQEDPYPFILEIPITVVAERVRRVEVTPATASAEVGETRQFTATVYGREDAVLDRPVTWSVDANATLDDTGVATATDVGTALITATATGVTSPPATLTVTEKTARTITVSPAEVSLEVGQTQPLAVTTYAHDGSVVQRAVTFTPSPAGIVSVDASGLITADAPGTATLTVSSHAATASVPVTVTAPPPTGLRIGGFDPGRSLTTSSGQIWDFLTSTAYGLARSEITSALPSAQFVAGTSAVTEAYLRGLDVFVVNKLDQGLSTEEICRLDTFVAGGGAVLDTRAIGGGDLLLGTTWGAFHAHGNAQVVAPTSPLIDGPFGNVGASVGVGFHDVFGNTADGLVVVDDGAGAVVLQFSEHATRRGRAVLVSDDEIFLSGADCCGANYLPASAANRTLLKNTFAWLAEAPGLDAEADFSACGSNSAAAAGAPGPRSAPGRRRAEQRPFAF